MACPIIRIVEMNIKKLKKIGPFKLHCLLANGKVSTFKLSMYRFPVKRDYYVIERGNIKKSEKLLVRLHSACSFSAVFNSQRCDCQAQLEEAMIKISKSEAGLLIYAWPHEGRNIGMWNHVRVYIEQDKGKDTVSSYEVLGLPIDSRDYSDSIEILKDYGVKQVRLLTNNPRKVEALRKAGIKVTRVPLIPKLNKYNESQIRTKVKKLGHYFPIKELIRNMRKE